MNIVYVATDSYLSMLGISMYSLLENTHNIAELKINVLSPDFSEKSKKILTDMCETYKVDINFYSLKDFEKSFGFTLNTAGFHPVIVARLLLTDFLPIDMNKVLYLDCDVIINGDISELDRIELPDNIAFAAVPELAMPPAQKKNIGLNVDEQYFNSGVLLINLDYWRKHNLKDQFINYYASANGKLMYADQDILNHCCKGHIRPLSHRYNLAPMLKYFPRFFIKSYQPAYYCKDKEEYKDILKNPSIIHFLGDERPWMRGNYNPYRKEYEYYKKKSLWKNEALIPGKEIYLWCYHMLNYITSICPWFRKAFTRCIGIRYYKMIGKKQ